MWLLLLVLTASSVREAVAGQWSSTQLFDSVVQLHFEEAKSCWGQQRIPSPRTIDREIKGMLVACDRFWPLDTDAPYRMAAVMVSESGGNTRNTAKPTEASYGPWCGTVDEAREAHRLFPDIPCPRMRDDVTERLQSDPQWAALVTAAALWRYDRAQGGDRIRGLLLYKFGAEGLRRACDRLVDKPVTDLPVWRHYASCLAWILCLRDRILMNSTPPCGCMAPVTP